MAADVFVYGAGKCQRACQYLSRLTSVRTCRAGVAVCLRIMCDIGLAGK